MIDFVSTSGGFNLNMKIICRQIKHER